MKVVRLEDTELGRRAYIHFHTALLRGGDVRGIEQISRVSRITTEIESIGVKEDRIGPDEQGRNVTGKTWRLQEGGGELWFESAEHAEMMTRMDSVNWLPQVAREIKVSYELLKAAPEEDPKKRLAEATAAAAAPPAAELKLEATG